MKELVRLVEGDANAAQRTLLEAGQTHRPPNDDARARTLAALTAVAGGVAVGSTTVAVTTAKTLGAGAALTRALSPAILKWCAVAAVGVGVSASAVLVVRHETAVKSALPATATALVPRAPHAGNGRGLSSAPLPTSAERVAPPLAPTPDLAPPDVPSPALPASSTSNGLPLTNEHPADSPPHRETTAVLPPPAAAGSVASTPVVAGAVSPSVPSEPTPVSPVPAGKASEATSTPPTTAAPPAVPSASQPEVVSLAREVRMLDEARAHLSSHEAAKALAALDRYATAFPGGVFLPEARVLRIEALLLAGDHASATRLADDLQRADPNGTYAQRVRKMIQSAVGSAPPPVTK